MLQTGGQVNFAALQGGQQVIVDVVLAGTVQLVDIELIQAEVAQRGLDGGSGGKWFFHWK